MVEKSTKKRGDLERRRGNIEWVLLGWIQWNRPSNGKTEKREMREFVGGGNLEVGFSVGSERSLFFVSIVEEAIGRKRWME